MLGGLISLAIGWIFYWRSGVQLRNEAARLRDESAQLRRLNEMLLGIAEDAGLVKLIRNDKGEITGRYVELSIHFQETGSLTANPTVERSEKKP